MIFLLIIIALIVVAVFTSVGQSKKKAALKSNYEQALVRSDKKAALNAGRAYYSALRKGKVLTIYDEQAITNDLSTMN